ncbi:2,3-dihydro-2,3-dihydroxybenzoate dehydrogenase [Streptomyces sp. NPDC005551]|uniref:2,3-dihydro-2,3-dihydroxybenzoate dehydrogenase n=1 Tax=Streptomyces sp. NPDC005551 TaxID=3364725 RepID=UPI0036A3B941
MNAAPQQSSTAPARPEGKYGEVALVTGAAGGIGAEIARALYVRGVSVGLIDRDRAALDVLATELKGRSEGSGARLLVLPTDVSRAADVEDAVETAERELGPVDRLVNAAGILRPGPVHGMGDADWHDTLAVNATGVFLMSRAVSARMMSRGGGAIVTVASNAARTARTDMAAYAASKAAAQAFTKCLGLELARHGIRCNVVAPGSTDTPMLTSLWSGDGARAASIDGVAEAFRVGIPTGRLALPSDVAQAVLFLLSEDAAHITLQDLTVDGGATLGV